MPRMPLQPCDHCYQNTSNVTSASENIKLKIMEDKLRNDFAEKEHTHEQYLTEEQILEKHYTKEETDGAIQKAAIEGKVDLNGYATEEWVESKKYLTEHQDISGKQDSIEDLEEIREGANLGKTALQEIPAEYITEEELEAKQYLTEHQSLEGYAKESFVEQKVAELVDSAPEALNTLNELAVAINNHEDAYDALLETVGNKANKEHEHDQYLTEHQSLEGYAKLTDIPEAEIYKVDFNAPNYVDAVEAYNNGKVLVLINAAPDVNSYAIMNYVSEKYITFTKFLTSRSEAYGLFNTYYLSPANTWEFSKEVRLNKVEANPSEEAVGDLAKVRIGKEVFTIPQAPSLAGFATEEFVIKKIAEAELNDKDIDISGLATKEELATKAEKEHTHSYNDLLGLPEIPEAYNDSEIRELLNQKATKDELSSLDQKIEENTVLYNELNDTVSNLVIPENLSELVNDANYTDVEKVLGLIENNADTKIGIDFTPNITVGYLGPNTPITADMTIGQIIYRMLYCEHDWLPSTCGEPYFCDFCGHNHPTLITEHNPETYGADIDATCTMPGSSMGVKCGDCGKILVPSETIPQLPHEPSAPYLELEPTCTEAGEKVIKCNNCGEYIDHSSVPALGHDYIDEITLNPTCTEDGVKTYICSNGCGETYTEVIPALGHNYIKDEAESTEATCESAGLLVEICEICKGRKETTIEALGHKYTSEVTLEPTCEEDGVRTYTCNNDCGESYTEVISKLGHKQAIREENRVAPDCANDGSYEKVTYCTECTEVLNRETIVLPALGHDYGDWVITKQPEVNVPGEQTKTCKRCGNVITEEIPALESEVKYYYLGGFGCDSQQDVPSAWAVLEEEGYPAFNPETRATYYVEEIKRNDAREYTDLVGQHELQWTITAPLGLDEAMTEALGEDVIISESDTFYPAIVIPSNYKVTAWSTDAENTYSSTEQLNNIEISDNYTVYYIELATAAEAYGNKTPTYFITIAEK